MLHTVAHIVVPVAFIVMAMAHPHIVRRFPTPEESRK